MMYRDRGMAKFFPSPSRAAQACVWLSSVMICVWATPLAAGQLGDDVNAFNGYILESPASGYSALKLVDVSTREFVQEVAVYEKPGETITLNGAPISRVQYRFAEGQLESIQLVYQGYDNRQKLLAWLEEHYGRLSSAERRMITQVMWKGDKMAIMLTFNRASNEGRLWFLSPLLHELVNRSTAHIPD